MYPFPATVFGVTLTDVAKDGYVPMYILTSLYGRGMVRRYST